MAGGDIFDPEEIEQPRLQMPAVTPPWLAAPTPGEALPGPPPAPAMPPVAALPLAPVRAMGTLQANPALAAAALPEYAPVGERAPLGAPPLPPTEAQYRAVTPHGWRNALGLLSVGLAGFGGGPRGAAEAYHAAYEEPQERLTRQYELQRQAYETAVAQRNKERELALAENPPVREMERLTPEQDYYQNPTPEKLERLRELAGVKSGAQLRTDWEGFYANHPHATDKEIADFARSLQKPATETFEEQSFDDWAKTHPGKTRADFQIAMKAAERPAKEPNEYADWKAKNPDKDVEDYWAAKGNAVDPMTVRTMQRTAPSVLDFIKRIEPEIDRLSKDLGPAAGRWSEFWAGRVGAPKPEYTELRTNMTLLSTLLMRMHMGARGGQQIMEHFQRLLDQGAQSPENLHASLRAIKDYANDLIAEGRQAQGGAAAGKTPAGATHIGTSRRDGKDHYLDAGGRDLGVVK